MTILSVTQFGGVSPRLPARSLPDTSAQSAVDCNLLNGVLKPFSAPSAPVFTSPKTGYPRSIYRFGQDSPNDSTFWFNWLTDVDVVKGPIAGDTNERTYFTGAGGKPQMTIASWQSGSDFPSNSRNLGIPAPASALTVGNGGMIPGATVSGSAVARVYVYTYVSDLMEEGPPSPATASVNVQSGQYATLTGFVTSVTGYPGINRTRIYRSLAGTSSTKYQMVGEVVLGTNTTNNLATNAPTWNGTTYADSMSDTALGATLPSTDWVPPPDDLMGLVTLPNGIMAGFRGNEVWTCEPYMPHAWAYSFPLEYEVVSIAPVAGQALAVATKGIPYIGTGAHPSYMTFSKMPNMYACVSKKSMVSVNGAAIYASADGLVMVYAGQVHLATESLFTRKEWLPLNPASFRAYQWQGRYVCFYTDATGAKGGFIFDPSMQSPQLVFLDFYATAGYYDPIYGYLYLVLDGTKDVVRFDYAGALPYTWKSKKFHTPDLTNFGCAQVLAESYPATFNYYADSATSPTFTWNVNSPDAFRLPSGFTCRDHEFSITGTATVYGVHVAQHMGELKRV